MDIISLNERFGIFDFLVFDKGKGGLDYAFLKNKYAEAAVLLMGANVIKYKPVDEKDVLWLGSKSFFSEGKPVRGGIPVCFPWFGVHPDDKDMPLHGFARLRNWNVVLSENKNEKVTLILEQKDDEETFKLWPFHFLCLLTVELDTKLSVTLKIRNTGSAAMAVTGALHSYFSVSDIKNISIEGFENTDYTDRADNNLEKTQNGKVRFDSEVLRLYRNAGSEFTIMDESDKRLIRVRNIGTTSAMVWNPWSVKCANFPDMDKDDYLKTFCLEAVKPAGDGIALEPGQHFEYGTVISQEKIINS